MSIKNLAEKYRTFLRTSKIFADKGLVIRAAIVTLIFNLPALFELIRYSGLSIRSFSDWDETVYLKLPFDFAEIEVLPFNGGINLLRQIQETYWVTHPHYLTDLVIGKLALSLFLTPTTLGFALDVLCIAISYVAFTKAYSVVLDKKCCPELTCLATLFLPWLSCLIKQDVLPSFFSFALTTQCPYFPSIPVTRGIYTQVSYPLIALCLYFTFKATSDSPQKNKHLIFSGVFSGLLLYVYFFAWGFAISFISCLLLIHWLMLDKRKPCHLFAILLSYIVPAFLISSPGLLLIFSTSMESLPLTPEMSKYWYFSTTSAVVALILIALLIRTQKNAWFLPIIALLLCSYLTEFALMNIQPIIKRLVTPFHFTTFYIYPIISGLLIAAFFGLVEDKKVRVISGFLLIFTSLSSPYIKALNSNVSSLEVKEFTELAKAVKINLHDSEVVAVLPFAVPFSKDKLISPALTTPYKTASLSNRRVFPALGHITAKSTAEQVRILITWLFSGRCKPIAACNLPAIELPGDIISGVITWANYFWGRKVCDNAVTIVDNFSPYDALINNSVTHVLWDNSHNLMKPQWLTYAAANIWQSPTNKFELYKIDLNHIRSHYSSCTS